MSLQAARLPAVDALRLTLDAPKGNIVDAAMMDALGAALAPVHEDRSLRAVIIDAVGKDFCFGASVEEHLPGACAAMLAKLHSLLRRLVELPVPVVVAVQGRCLGGGLELALAGSRIIAAPTSAFAQPEIKLGVFAPAASALLAQRVGNAAAEDLLITGRTVSGAEALSLGLVDELCGTTESPFDRAVAWAAQLKELSPSSLRYAVRAARMGRAEELARRLATLERLYLDELMTTADANEGLTAFVARRAPRWTGGAS